MILHKEVKTYDKRTGKEAESEWLPTRIYICDYTGEECDSDQNYDFQWMYKLETHYYNGIEQVWYYDDDNRKYFEEGLKINYGSIFSHPFMFAPQINGTYCDASYWLSSEWMDAVEVKGHTFYECSTIEEAMRRARVRTIKRLLEEKAYTKEQLGLLEEPY
jgi:hypothetical protein